MPEVKVEFKDIEDLKLSTKDVKDKGPMVQVTFLTRMSPIETARLLHIHYAGHGLNAIISSPQATMDLKMETVDLLSGELKD